MTFSPLGRRAKRLRIYFGESDQWRGRPLYLALLDALKKQGLAGATVVRGVAGFGAHSRIHTASILRLSEDLPLILEVIDTPEKIEQALEVVSAMVREGLVTLEDVEVVAYTHRYLHPLPADRPVREVITREPVSVQAEEAALDAWKRMLAHGVKALPVVDDQGVVMGLLTSEDLVERAGLSARLAVAQRLDEETLRAEMELLRRSGLRVKEVMSQPPITVRAEDSLGLAAARMVRHAVTRLPVVDEQGRLIGMISRLDVLRQVMEVPRRPLRQTAPHEAARLVGEVMTGNVPRVNEDADLPEVVGAFLSSGEHRLIVVDGEGRPVGLISDSDVIGRIQPQDRRGVLGALRGRNVAVNIKVKARELMSPGVETITADTTIVEAVHRMLSLSRKWLVVVDEAGRPLGLIDREIALESLIR
uniref:CBS domain-containing protein n=1 Tax=Anaerolinea thermolimosa TaxID=229919 RepID=A0A7C4PI78_9CHLR